MGTEAGFLLGTPPPPPQQGPLDPGALGGAAPANAGALDPATPAASGVASTGGTPPPSPVPLVTVDMSQDPLIGADRVALYRTRELPSIAGAVLVCWLLLFGGYLRRVRRRRGALGPGGDRERP